MIMTCNVHDDDNEGATCFRRGAFGAALGYGVAVALDWFVLSSKTEIIPANGWASLRPSLNVTPNGAQAGVAFQF